MSGCERAASSDRSGGHSRWLGSRGGDCRSEGSRWGAGFFQGWGKSGTSEAGGGIGGSLCISCTGDAPATCACAAGGHCSARSGDSSNTCTLTLAIGCRLWLRLATAACRGACSCTCTARKRLCDGGCFWGCVSPSHRSGRGLSFSDCLAWCAAPLCGRGACQCACHNCACWTARNQHFCWDGSYRQGDSRAATVQGVLQGWSQRCHTHILQNCNHISTVHTTITW